MSAGTHLREPGDGRVQRSRRWALLRAATLPVVGLSQLLAVAAFAAWRAVLAPGPAVPDDLLAALCGTAALLIMGWLCLAVAVTAAAALCELHGTGHSRLFQRLAGAVAPRLLRNGVAAVLGLAVMGSALPATATEPPGSRAAASRTVAPADARPFAGSAAADRVTGTRRPPATAARTSKPLSSPPSAQQLSPAWTPAPPAPTGSAAGSDLSPGWVPAEPAASRRAAPTRPPVTAWPGGEADRLRPGVDPIDEVVVRRGETLWGIAARHLGPGAGAAEVAAEWPHWFSANLDVIGPDPDVLHPGQRLRPPAASPSGLKQPPRATDAVGACGSGRVVHGDGR